MKNMEVNQDNFQKYNDRLLLIERESNEEITNSLLNRNIEKDKIIEELRNEIRSISSDTNDSNINQEEFIKLVDENERLSIINKELKQKVETLDNENFVLNKEKSVLQQMVFLLKTEKTFKADEELAKSLQETSCN